MTQRCVNEDQIVHTLLLPHHTVTLNLNCLLDCIEAHLGTSATQLRGPVEVLLKTDPEGQTCTIPE